jgi:hypothetical protein
MLLLNFPRKVHIVSSESSPSPSLRKMVKVDYFVTTIGQNTLEVSLKNLQPGSGPPTNAARSQSTRYSPECTAPRFELPLAAMGTGLRG